ncbi:MAG: hypothetical protein ACHQ1E_04770 [Ktedonobacterales bacterium]|jgi:hypothetical protein
MAAVYEEFGDRYADEHNTSRTAEILVTIDEILPPQHNPNWMVGHFVARTPARWRSNGIQANIAHSLVKFRMYHLDFEDKTAAQEALEELHNLLVQHGWRYTGHRGNAVDERQYVK